MTDCDAVIKWLEEVDLAEYKEKLCSLGIKKAAHFKDVTNEDLKSIGMAPLEVRRFNRKVQDMIQADIQYKLCNGVH